MGICCGTHYYIEVVDKVADGLFPKKKNNKLLGSELSKDELRDFYDAMKKTKMQLHFLTKVNNKRCGNTKINENDFDTLKNSFLSILENIEAKCKAKFLKENKKLNLKPEDIENIELIKKYAKEDQLIILNLIYILSITFYVGDKDNEYFLSEEIKNVKILKEKTTWEAIIDHTIEENAKNSIRIGPKKTLDEKKNKEAPITLTNYIPMIISNFQVEKEKMKEIVQWASEKYKLSPDDTNDLNQLIENQEKAIENYNISLK